ncbi:hypothetical protein AWC38_SpisGene24305 [Stylophora pistillata]|uniref:YqaJ viral recombinase domain-containing protein n=1 Tax=Stylophora pistillata TaxID=50429 RepID=A0A2B4R633_STYPI|nr:hypothetical protein AWC38_SpisGene24305 [Stylophora pistillata]
MIKQICYPEVAKFSTEATEQGCRHEPFAIRTYEELMKTTLVNFKVKECGLVINEDMPWLHAPPDLFCECDCCDEGIGEVKCPLCLENCDFESYVQKSNTCLTKDSQGRYTLPHDQSYYYQVQQQLFTTKRPFCDFVVCAVGLDQVMLVHQRILPGKPHWDSVVPKLENFWRVCVLPEILGRWSTRRDPLGWLDCVIIHEAQTLLFQIDKNIKGFQRATLGAVRQFDVMAGDFI